MTHILEEELSRRLSCWLNVCLQHANRESMAAMAAMATCRVFTAMHCSLRGSIEVGARFIVDCADLAARCLYVVEQHKRTTRVLLVAAKTSCGSSSLLLECVGDDFLLVLVIASGGRDRQWGPTALLTPLKIQAKSGHLHF